jgi:hypothetical protein
MKRIQERMIQLNSNINTVHKPRKIMPTNQTRKKDEFNKIPIHVKLIAPLTKLRKRSLKGKFKSKYWNRWKGKEVRETVAKFTKKHS